MAATTVYEKIEKLKTIKDDLKTEIEAKGVTVGTIPFDEYAGKVAEIATGSGATGNAVVGDVLATKTFSNSASTGLTGTMPNIGAQNITPSASNQSISAGYHNGSGVVAGDADLVTGNIKAGVTIFGVAGKTEVVDTSSGDAVAADMKSGKKAWVDGVEVTGNIPTQTLSAASTTVSAGYYAATTLEAVDTDLTAANIKKDVNIFGVVGSFSGDEYTRPADWLPIDHLVSVGDQKIVGLVAVFDNSSNYITFRGKGAYTIDWGDGSAAENIADNTKAEHNYDYADLSSATECSRGYRQAIITITPQAGQNLTWALFYDRHSATSATGVKNYGWLDIRMSAPELTTMYVGYNAVGNQVAKRLEKFNFLGTNKIASMDYVFYGCSALIYLRINTALATTFREAFVGCAALRDFDALDCTSGNTASVYMIYSLFSGCGSLEKLPTMTMPATSVTNVSLLVFNCGRVSALPDLVTASVQSMTTPLSQAFCLREFPAWNLTGITSAANMPPVSGVNLSLIRIKATNIKWSWSLIHNMLGYDAIAEVIGNLYPGVTAQTLTITGNPGAAAIMAAITAGTITVPAGWTVAN